MNKMCKCTNRFNIMGNGTAAAIMYIHGLIWVFLGLWAEDFSNPTQPDDNTDWLISRPTPYTIFIFLSISKIMVGAAGCCRIEALFECAFKDVVTGDQMVIYTLFIGVPIICIVGRYFTYPFMISTCITFLYMWTNLIISKHLETKQSTSIDERPLVLDASAIPTGTPTAIPVGSIADSPV